MALTEKINIILIMRGYGNLNRSFQQVADLFNAENNKQGRISKSTVARTILDLKKLALLETCLNQVNHNQLQVKRSLLKTYRLLFKTQKTLLGMHPNI